MKLKKQTLRSKDAEETTWKWFGSKYLECNTVVFSLKTLERSAPEKKNAKAVFSFKTLERRKALTREAQSAHKPDTSISRSLQTFRSKTARFRGPTQKIRLFYNLISIGTLPYLLTDHVIPEVLVRKILTNLPLEGGKVKIGCFTYLNTVYT